MTNIGTTRSSVSYLISVLLKITDQLEQHFDSLNPEESRIVQDRIYSLTQQAPSLPDFSHFHDSFRPVAGIPGGNMRDAFFLAYDESKCEYLKLDDCQDVLNSGRQIVSASFVIPYPPGFPVLVPGQVMTEEILNFLLVLDVKEIHGYRPELGLRIFKDEALTANKKYTEIKETTAAPTNGSSKKKVKTTAAAVKH
jgi:arginine decarboxylase